MGADPTSGLAADADPEILGVAADSREVRPGYLFVAVPGSRTDGRRFVADAVARGAAAVVTDPAAAAGLRAELAIPVVADPNPRRRLALVAAGLSRLQPQTVAAVTGTNGKTSTAAFTRQIWAACGQRAASIGTLGIERPDRWIPGAMTTPDPVTLHNALAELKRDGIEHVVMEASSHGLDQHRLDGVRLAAAAFTNLTQDHLDYHGTMAAYRDAKLRLFGSVLAPGGAAVLNADVPEFALFAATARAAGHPVLDYGAGAEEIRLAASRAAAGGQALELEVQGRRHEVVLPLAGGFQVMNALAALGLALATGMPQDAAVAALGRLQGVRGRLEHVATLRNGAVIYVDYAHTPDGLDKLLTALRPHTTGRLVCVFGAGGDRDPTKRPLMGAVVARLADRAVVTDDNPRSEDPAAIRRAILEACPDAEEIGDRARAIEAAIRGLGAGDVLVIAGKGHEQGQTIAGMVHPFDDAGVARIIAARLGEGR